MIYVHVPTTDPKPSPSKGYPKLATFGIPAVLILVWLWAGTSLSLTGGF